MLDDLIIQRHVLEEQLAIAWEINADLDYRDPHRARPYLRVPDVVRRRLRYDIMKLSEQIAELKEQKRCRRNRDVLATRPGS
jgi:hypothetical protein